MFPAPPSEIGGVFHNYPFVQKLFSFAIGGGSCCQKQHGSRGKGGRTWQPAE